MLNIRVSFLIGALSFLVFIAYKTVFVSFPSIPKIDDNINWDSEGNLEEDASVRGFKINVFDEVIEDLKWRLENHRPLVPPIVNSTNQYGINPIFLKEIIDFWRFSYNWTERQAYLNRYPQFMTNIQGLDIHFIHVKPEESKNMKAIPLLLLHGWPGSVREFYDVIELLTTNSTLAQETGIMLEVIVPSLPGFGFSQSTSKPGLDTVQVAIIMKKLMNRLGHQHFFVNGGDMGAVTLQNLCVLYPESVLGFHTNFPLVYTLKGYLKPILGLVFPSLVVKPEHYDRVYPLFDWGKFIFQESGYLHIQSTKPDTLGVAINESPVALAAYFLEKFIVGTNFTWINDFDSQELAKKYPYENLVDNLMYYWISKTATTSFRLYYETFGNTFWSNSLILLRIPIQVPTIIFRSKCDLYMADGLLNEIYPNLLRVSDYDTGHFAAFENPVLFSRDLLSAMKIFINYHCRNK